MKIYIVNGGFADGSQMTSWSEAYGEIVDGEHMGKKVAVLTAKYDCGAYSEEVYFLSTDEYNESMDNGEFSGSYNNVLYHNEMNGCWQWGHEREGFGEAPKYIESYERQQEETTA